MVKWKCRLSWHFLTPIVLVFNILYCICISVSRIRINEGKIEATKPSIVRKIICFILQAFLIFMNLGQLRKGEISKHTKSNHPLKIILTFYRCYLLAFIFTLLTTLYIFWFKMPDVIKIINQIQNASVHFRGNLPTSKAVQIRRNWLCLIIIFGTISIFNFLAQDLEFFEDFESLSNHTGALARIFDQSDDSAESLISFAIWGYDKSEFWEYPEYISDILSVLLLFLTGFDTFNGVLIFIFQLTWCICIRQLFLNLYNKYSLVQDNCVSNVLNPSAKFTKTRMDLIKDFNELVKLIHSFNQVFGWNILFTTLNCILFSSVNILETFFNNYSFWYQLSVILTFSIMAINLISFAEIHKLGKMFSTVMKKQIQHMEFSTHDDNKIIIPQLILIGQEIQLNSVGINGQDCFTISYSFIVSVLGVIATYSILVIQLDSNVIK